MKKLFKNSFFSFFKNKLAISLLMIIVFLTTATFTMFNSATHAFKKSYDQVMTEGDRHEYTIKEMYNIEGDATFTTPQAVAGESITETKYTPKAGAANVKSIGGKNYLLFEINSYFEGELFNGQIPVPIQNPSNVVVAASFDDISNYKNNGSLQLDSYIVNVDIDFGAGAMPIPATSITGVDSTATIGNKLIIKPNEPMAGVSSQPIHDDLRPFDYKINFMVNDANDFHAIFDPALAAGADSTTISNQVYSMTLARNAVAFPQEIKDVYYKMAKANPDLYTYKFAVVTPTPDFNDENLAIKFKDPSTPFKTFGEYKNSLKNKVELDAKTRQHKELLDYLTQSNEWVYKDVESFKVNNNSQSFKFVLDSDSQVDKMKLYEGFALPQPLGKDEMFKKFVNEQINFAQRNIDVVQAEIDTFKPQKSALRNILYIHYINQLQRALDLFAITSRTPEQEQELQTIISGKNADGGAFPHDEQSIKDKIKAIMGMEVAYGGIPATTAERDEKIALLVTQYNFPSQPDSWLKMVDVINDKIQSLDQKINDTRSTITNFQNPAITNQNTAFFNGWSTYITSSFDTYKFVDPTSYAAIVSPTYASNNNIKPMGQDVFNKIVESVTFKDTFLNPNISFDQVKTQIENIASDNGVSKSLLWVGQTPYFVTGVGITPDFAFPIMSQDEPLPNTQTQAVVYTNNAGYLRLKDANPAAPTENYVAIKFKEGKFDQKEAVAKLSKYLEETTSWPSSIKALSAYDSSEESILMTPTRVTFLENLNHTISSVSWIVTSLLVLFTAFIVALVIKKQIDNRKKQLGILMANGYSKLEIATSMMVIGLIVAVVPALAGYLVGHFMQFALMNIFSNYWTLPIWRTQFSWIALVVTVVAPLAGMSLLAFLISLYTLRGRIPDILAGETTKSGFVTKQIMKPVKYFGIKTKMGMSLVFSNVGKLSIAFVAFGASIIALAVSMNSIGKFDAARSASEAATNYEYQIDLETATKEAGQYGTMTMDSMYYDANANVKIDPNDIDAMTDKVLANMNKPYYDDHVSFHAAFEDAKNNIGDGEYSAAIRTNPSLITPFYLKNRIQIQPLLDIAITSTGTNPWKIASRMMPENQKNAAELMTVKFMQYAAQKFDRLYNADFNKAVDIGLITKDQNGKYIINKEKAAKEFQLIREYKELIAVGLQQATQDYKKYEQDLKSSNSSVRNAATMPPLPYFITYNNVLIDEDDELYTHVDVNYSYKSISDKHETKVLRIRGIDDTLLDEGKSQISLSRSSINALKNYKSTNGETPIVINKYFSEYYQVKNGDVISGDVKNMIDRKQAASTRRDTKQSFKIVGVEKTYNDNKVYTLQSYANKVIGLDTLTSNPLAPKPFNGVFTKHKDSLVLNSAPLYSPSGVYPGKNSIKHGNSNEDGYFAVASYFEKSGNKLPSNPVVSGVDKDATMDKWISTYASPDTDTSSATSISPMQSVYSSIDWSKVSDYQFTSIMDLSSALMNTVQIIVMFIALAFVLLISTMIIADNTKFIATLKVMGYRTKEISRIFLATFIPSLLLALAVSIPLVFGLEEAIRVGIMGFGHVLIPLYIAGWEVAAAFGILVVGFLAMYFISLRGLKNTSLLQAFQE